MIIKSEMYKNFSNYQVKICSAEAVERTRSGEHNTSAAEFGE